MSEYNLRARSRSATRPVMSNPSQETVRKMSRVELVNLAKSINSTRGVIQATQGYITKNKTINGRNVPKQRGELLEEICQALGYPTIRSPIINRSNLEATQEDDGDDEVVYVGAAVSTPQRRQPLGDNHRDNAFPNTHVTSPLNYSAVDHLHSYPLSPHPYYNVAGPSKQTIAPTDAEMNIRREFGAKLEVVADRLRKYHDLEKQVTNLQNNMRELEDENRELEARAVMLESAGAGSVMKRQWASSLLEKMEREIECPICLEDVIAVPVTFRETFCQHTVCARCMLTILYAKFSPQQRWTGGENQVGLPRNGPVIGPGSIECPKCHAATTLPNEKYIRKWTTDMRMTNIAPPSPLMLNRTVDSMIEFALELLEVSDPAEWSKGSGIRRLEWDQRVRVGKEFLDQFNRAWNSRSFTTMGQAKAQFLALQ